jgi:hypothetical protein
MISVKIEMRQQALRVHRYVGSFAGNPFSRVNF